jgi:AraC-like DNA-binding protein
VCGFLGCDLRPYNPLLAALPRCLHARGVAGAGDWLSEFPRLVVAESRQGRAGDAAMLTRMAELMFVEVVRRQLAALPSQQAGWLAGLRDPVVARALVQLHEHPAHPWTLADLARAVATSRTVLAERFSRLVGVPPMQYLAQWRLQLAAEQLVRGAEKIAAIGAAVGYESEAAFSRAFKRATGYGPAAWRRARGQR